MSGIVLVEFVIMSCSCIWLQGVVYMDESVLGWRPLAEAWLANRSPQESHVSISECFVTLLWEILSSIESANFMRNLNLCEFVYIRAPFLVNMVSPITSNHFQMSW